MAGPWEKYKNQSSGPWNKYAAPKSAAPSPPQESGLLDDALDAVKTADYPGMANAAGTGAVNGATMGYLPQIVGGAKALVGNDYAKARDEEVAREKALTENHPIASAAGSLAGAIAVPIPGLTELQLAKEAGIGAKLALGAGKGAAVSALANPGDAPGSDDALQIKARLKNAAMGGVLGAGSEALVQGIEKSPEMLQSVRRWMTAKQLGANTSQVKQLLQDSGDSTKLEQLEKFLDENGMMGIGATYSGVVDKTKKIMDESGQKIGDIYSHAPETINAPELAQDFINQNTDRLNKTHGGSQVLENLKRDLGVVKDDENLFAPFQQPKKGLSALGPEATAADLHKYRISVDDKIPFGSSAEQKLGAMENKGLRSYLNDRLQETVSPQDLPDLINENERFHLAATANKIATNTKAREMSKHILGVMGGIGGVGEAMHAHDSGDNWIQAGSKGLLTGLAVRGGGMVLPALAYKGAKLAQPAAEGLAKYMETPQGRQRVLQSTVIPWDIMNQENQK